MKPEPLKDKATCLNCLNTPCKCGLNNSAFTKPSGDAVGLLHHDGPMENLDAKLLPDNFGLYHKPGLQ